MTTDTTYKAYIERDNGELAEFPDVVSAMQLPTGDVQVETTEGATVKVPQADIIRLRQMHDNE